MQIWIQSNIYSFQKVYVWLGCFITLIEETLQMSDEVNVTLFRQLDSTPMYTASSPSAHVHTELRFKMISIFQCKYMKSARIPQNVLNSLSL